MTDVYSDKHQWVGVSLKEVLTRVGAYVPERILHLLNATLNYLTVGSWMRLRGFGPSKRLKRREEVFECIAEGIPDVQVLYLEFGVFEGASLRLWSQILCRKKAELHGFDSFLGLPSRWNAQNPRAHFSTGGNSPSFPDDRVSLHIGWFKDTLPSFVLPPHDVLIVNIDADLYSSAMFVLETLRSAIRTGTYIYFDEFSDRENELRAFGEFLDDSQMKFRLVGATRKLSHVAFQRVA